MVQNCSEAAHQLVDKPSERHVYQRRRDMLEQLLKAAAAWHQAMVEGLRNALQQGAPVSRHGEPMPSQPGGGGMSLVDDDTIEREIMTSRLALAIMDRAASEFSDLASRMTSLEHVAELDNNDLLRAHVVARVLVDAWRASGQSVPAWHELRPALHDEVAARARQPGSTQRHRCGRSTGVSSRRPRRARA